MATTKASQKAVNKYIKNNYDRIIYSVKKGQKQALQEIAQSQGDSLNGYTKKALKAKILSDTGKEIEL